MCIRDSNSSGLLISRNHYSITLSSLTACPHFFVRNIKTVQKILYRFPNQFSHGVFSSLPANKIVCSANTVRESTTSGHSGWRFKSANATESSVHPSTTASQPFSRKMCIRDRSLFGPVTPNVPASILQLHPNLTVVSCNAL